MGSKILVIGLVAIFLFGLFGFALAVFDAQGERPVEPAPPSLPAIPAAAAVGPIRLALAETSTQVPSDAPVEASPSPALSPSALTASSSAEPAATTATVMPIVPVTGFWSTRDVIKSRDIWQALERGTAKGFKSVIVEDGIADELAESLGVELHAKVRRGDADAISAVVAKGGLGLLPATHVTPAMRTLGIDDVALVGNDRIRDVADWPLDLTLETTADGSWDQAQTWVLVAGGDAFTDRGVYDKVVRKGKGVNYPFDGGTARVTGHGCCDPVYHDNVVPRYQTTGNKGLVRNLFKGAELAIANHEQPVTDAAVHHTSGLRFSGQPELTKIFTRAGLDFLSLANNHIKDYGADGIKDTRRILRRNGLAFGGAGADLDQARKISYLHARDTKVAIIPCLDIVPIYWAAADESGATPCLDRYLVPDIKRAATSADVVIVFPHWGVEYSRQPLPSMRKHAARWAKAGADTRPGCAQPRRRCHRGHRWHARDVLAGQLHLRPELVHQHHGIGSSGGHVPWRPARRDAAASLHHPRHHAAQPA